MTIVRAAFWLAMGLVLGLEVWLQARWSMRPPSSLVPLEPILPPFAEAVQNARLMFQGYADGYLRTLLGYGRFALLSCFFLSVGRMVYFAILKPADRPSWTEGVAWSWILGTLVSSLLWFGLGMAGTLNPNLAWGLAFSGLAAFLYLFVRGRTGPALRERLRAWKGCGPAEKILCVLLLAVLLLFSAAAVNQPAYSDSLMTHLALPSYYIHWGRIVPNPYHFHSYFPQNTEMLALWSLLLRSDFCAGLVAWGFLPALVLLLLGFLRRHAGSLAGVAAALALLSAPIIGQSALMVKNDLPMALFSVAHYCALVEAFRRRQDNAGFKSWGFLAALACGGAIGHKLSAVSTGAVSSLLVLAMDAASFMKGDKRLLAPWWFLGLALSLGPWFLRTYAATGNPIYPLANSMFTGRYLQPWHGDLLLRQTLTLGQYGRGVLLGANLNDGPGWGPPALFSLLAITALFFRCPAGFKPVLGAALATYVAMLNFQLGLPGDIRYHIGLLAFLTCAPLALAWRDGAAGWRRWPALGIVLAAFFQGCIEIAAGTLLRTSLTKVLSGYSPGNYASTAREEDQLSWLYRRVNRGAGEGDAVLCAGVQMVYGLDRRLHYGFLEDRQPIADIARASTDAGNMAGHLRGLGIRHVIVNATFVEDFRSHPQAKLRIGEEDLEKIGRLLNTAMHARAATPDGRFFWYAIDPAPSPAAAESELLNFPWMFLQEVRARIVNARDDAAALSMLESALRSPIHRYNRAFALSMRAIVLRRLGRLEEAENSAVQATQVAPENPEPQVNLALFYDYSRSGPAKVLSAIRAAVAAGGDRLVAQYPSLVRYLQE